MNVKRLLKRIGKIFAKQSYPVDPTGITTKYDISISGLKEEVKYKKVTVQEEAPRLDQIKNLERVSYKPIGRCIYCGASGNLQREHIVPLGLCLRGTAVLPKSTCGNCAKIIGHFEGEVLRGPMWAVRVYRQLKSRTKHADAPKTAKLRVKKNDNEFEIELPLDEYPILLHFPIFSPPAFLSPSGYTKGINISGIATISFGPNPKTVLSKIGATAILATGDYKPVAFARMIAKIAYAFAVAEGAINLIDGEPFVLPAILGQRDEIGMWVGTLTEPYKSFKGLLHHIMPHEDRERGLLIVEVQLFADSQTPRYGVILGKLK
jgi:hypothetical protein